jgi:predicted permease
MVFKLPKDFSFPPFITFLIACVMNILNFEFLDFLQVVFKTTGSFVTPLALLSVGLQLRFDRKRRHFWD